MKPKYSLSRLRHSAGASLVTAIIVCLPGAASAANWNGSVDADWNTFTNWDGGVGTGGTNAIINVSGGGNPPYTATISAPLVATPVDILIGQGGGTNGTLNHTLGTAATGGGNWMYVGKDGGIGKYNLANTALPGGINSGFAIGGGSMNVGGKLFVGHGAGGTGTLNMNTSGTLSTGGNLQVGDMGTGTLNLDAGTLSVGGECWVGQSGSGNGTFVMNSGALSVNNWVAVGREGGQGSFTLNGGTFAKTGGGEFIVGDGSKGTFVQNGGALTVNNQMWIGQGGQTSTYTLNLGTITVNSWIAVARNGGVGTLTMASGTITKTGGGNFTIGSGGAGMGTVNLNGGLIDVQSGNTFVGETGSASSTLNLSGGALNTPQLLLGLGGSATGTANLNTGATLRTSYIGGGSTTANVNFNGTQIIATASASPFISDLDVANIDAGGLKIDSDGKNLSSGQIFTGPGGLEKSGLGTLTLSGAYTFGGTKDVIAGKLVTTTNAIGTGAYTVAAGGGLGVVQAAMDAAQTTTGVTFGATGASLDMDLGDFAGNTTAAPLNVTGTLTLNGPVTLNVADILPVASITPIPLVSYVGPKVGGGAFTLGTLPNGVVATLGDNGTGLVSLTVTRAAIPYWVGTPGDLWNTTDANWVNDYTEAATTYANGDPVLFDDRGAFGTTDVVLNTTVTPGSSGVIISNAYTPYTLNTTGVGKISGSTGLLKEGASSLTIGLPLNDYLGVTTLAGGTTTVTKLANGGSASSIGKSSAAATNLVLAGGTLYYTGATVSIDRGFTTTSSGGGIGIDNNLTLSGAAVATGGNFVKTGPGILTLTHNGANTFGGAGDYGLGVLGGTLAMNGTSVTQSNSVIGELRVGFDPGVSAHAVFTNTTVSCTGYLTLGRGNGTGATSTLTATGSTMTSGAFSSGYNAGLSENASNQTITLTNTNWTSNGRILLAEIAGSNTLLTVAGTSTITKNAEYLSIGVEGAATVTLKDSATLTSSGDFNVADVGGSNGTLNIQNTATVNATGSTFWGRGANSTSAINISGGAYNGGLGMVASNATSTSTITQTGGAVVFGANDRLWFGQNGQATWNQSAGTATCNGYLVVGRLAPSVAVWNVTGGTLTQNPPVPGEYPGVILAEAGTGTVNISGTGVFNANGQQINMATSGGNGTLNVNPGGTLRTARIMETNTGTSAVNFDGGTLIANTNANLDFLSGIDTTTVKSGGVTVDSNGQSIGINVAMLDGGGGGGLTKNGAGFLQLNAANTYTGTTTVSAGSLGGTGAVAGPLVVAPTAILAPGASAGTLTAGATTISGTYACEIDGATSDKLVVNGSLNVSAGSLVITQLSAPTAPVYIIASYTGATPANFNSVTGLPAGYSLVYNYLGGNQIALVGTVAPYDSWAASKGLTGANNGPTQDPEFDGISNLLEFILGGNPLASDPSILPAQTLTANDFIFTFNRADESESGITQTFQYGSSLTGWTNISIGASPGTSPVGIVENGASPDTVTVTIPRSSAVGGKLFGRLNAVK